MKTLIFFLMFNVLNHISGPSFSPLDLDPQAYFAFNTGITYDPTTFAVSQWDDQTGNGYNATQATAAQQPTFNTSTGLVQSGQYKSLATGYSWTDPSTVTARLSIPFVNFYYMGHNVGRYKRVRTTSPSEGRTEYWGPFFNTYSQPVSSDLYNISILQDSPGTANGFRVYIDGVEVVNVTTPSTTFSGGNFLIGSIITNYIFSGGYFHSLALFNRVIENTEREELENYFTNESI